MKAIITILLMLAVSISYAQLNENARIVKSKIPDAYSLIKDQAVEKWGSDHEMVVYTINNQCDSYYNIAMLTQEKNFDLELLENCMAKWSKVVGEDIKWIDWEMVEYEYTNQITAKNAY